MKRLADGLHLLRGFPPNLINVYLLEDVLVDSGTRYAAGRIQRQLRNQRVTVHALTHVHADHQGSSHRLCERFGIPLWCGEADADAMETPGLMLSRMPDHWFNRAFSPRACGPPHAVARRLHEGDEVAGFRVIEVPGHTAGHVAFWRESDRSLVLGDVLASINPLSGSPGLREPPPMFTPDPAENRRSARTLAALEPALVCFGHGPPLRDTKRFVEFVASLPV